MDPSLIIVANRGPNDFVWQEGAWVTRPASGGLVSMLEPLARRPDVSSGSAVSPSRPTPSRRARACIPPPPMKPTRTCISSRYRCRRGGTTPTTA